MLINYTVLHEQKHLFFFPFYLVLVIYTFYYIFSYKFQVTLFWLCLFNFKNFLLRHIGEKKKHNIRWSSSLCELLKGFHSLISTENAGHEISRNVGDVCNVTIQNCDGYNPEEPCMMKCVPVSMTASEGDSTEGKCAIITDYFEQQYINRYAYWYALIQQFIGKSKGLLISTLFCLTTDH